MTTYIFEGINIRYDYDPNTDTETSAYQGPGELRVVVDSASETFSYNVIGIDGLAEVDFVGDVQMAALNYNNIDALEDQFNTMIPNEIGNVTWPGGVTTVLGFSIQTDSVTNQDFYFALGGAPLPTIQNTSQWLSFENSVTNAGVATGALAPGATIAWKDLPASVVTEDDEFVGTNGRDRFDGGAGDDYFNSSAGNDTYIGGGGSFDQLNFAFDPGAVTVNFAKGTARDGFGNTDSFSGMEVVRASLFNDTLIGKKGSQVFRGLEGNDTINGARGVDTVRFDRDARFDGGDGAATVNLKKGFAIDGFGDRDSLKSIENATGTEKNDKFIGNGAKNVFVGLGGNDRFEGLGGNDTMTGGSGNDRFVFKGNFGDDTITDFSTKGRKEKIDISKIDAIRNFKDLKNNHLTDDGNDVVIDDGSGNTITLEGLQIADLSSNDFIF
jgi:Ca2+-binding RTX toxin-like protein